jgi:membrane protease YdiL (CAAX protease family)
MLALAAANAIGVVLFGTLYAIAGAHLLPQLAFAACLLVLLVFMTVVWVRTEARHRGLDPLRRIGRISGGLLLVVVVTPAIVLAPLFWLDEQLPAEAGLRAARGGVMALVLITLVLVVLVNVMGVLVVIARAVVSRRLGGRSVTPPSGRISA